MVAGFETLTRGAFSAIILTLVTLSTTYGSSGGISGRTQKPGSAPGCGCHGTQNAGTTLSFTGSSTVAAGRQYPFTVSLSGTSGSNGGIDIAAFRGTLATSPSETFLRILNSELTHTQARPVPTSFQFNYTAPATAGTDTVYATGKGGASSNSWNHAPRFVITVVTPPPAVTLVSPANNSTNVPIRPTMTWTTSQGATSYRLQVSANPGFTTTVYDDSTITGTSRQLPSPLTNGTQFFWRVGAKNVAGTTFSAAWGFTTSLTAVGEAETLPEKFGVSQNYPNPFNPATQIGFDVPVASSISLTVFDITGKEVATIAKGVFLPGRYSARWNGLGYSSGLYLIQFRAINPVGNTAFLEVRKMILAK